MVTGSEAVDALIKIARKWAYVKKGIPKDEAIILTVGECYHGLTLTTMCLSNRMSERMCHLFPELLPAFASPTKINQAEGQSADGPKIDFGKHLSNVGPYNPKTGQIVRYGEVKDLEKALEECGGRIAAVLIEPVQGFAG